MLIALFQREELSTWMRVNVDLRPVLPQQLVTAPAHILSSLVVEGYKKMILVSLILSGFPPVLPKYASNTVARQLKTHTLEYELLGTRCQVSK